MKRRRTKKILFVAYLYPPAGGKALPGVQRVVKFIKYLDSIDKYVLTLKPELYPDFFSLDNAFRLPVNNEQIIRTGELNLFNALIRVKNLIPIKKTCMSHSLHVSEDAVKVNNEDENKSKEKSKWQEIKDFVSEILTFPDYASGWIIPALLNGKEIIIREKIDVIFATGMPWTSLLVGAGLKGMTGVKLIVDFRDPWATNPFTHEKNKLIRKLENRAERIVVAAADCVTLNTPELADEFKKKYNEYSSNRFITLHNGYDPEILEIENVKSTYRDADKLVISHVGYLYGLRDPMPMLKALAIAQEKASKLGSRIVFQQIGYTNLAYDIDTCVSTLGINQNFIKLGHLPFSEALRCMDASDILIIIQPQTTTQIPSKIYEYIFYNKPIIAIGSRDGALANLINTYGFGKIFSESEIEKLADFLVCKAREKKRYGRLSIEYEKKEAFDIRNIAAQLIEIINNICH